MHLQTTTHATLLARIAGQGGDAAWGEFVARYGDLIRGFAVRQGLQAADCDDVVQDVLVKLGKALPGFTYDPAKGRFRGYLKTVVLRCIFDLSCQRRGERAVEKIEELTQAAGASPDVDDAWEVEWRRYHLRQAMGVIRAEFNDRDVAAFQQYSVDGEEAQAVAAALGMSLDAVYQAKSRILRRLGELIELQVKDEG
ncbi:MAG: sigma-70 family RNA polymerase sigma factor [Phycisphaerae bacterium]